jgi:hypothetical protein
MAHRLKASRRCLFGVLLRPNTGLGSAKPAIHPSKGLFNPYLYPAKPEIPHF